ncbi:MAG: CaiB/BaiF CoA-transferase family protein [Chitinophagales bacterium]|nr:CaiB/BaiF CoA-transferase family protein [Chitinophagales bacterium]
MILQGIKVLELASVLAGPSVGMFFAELGATVIKIENPSTHGDMTRSWKLPEEDPQSNISAYFASVNWGKQHLFIDLKSPEGKKQVYQLAADSDIVISNYKPGDDKKLGMDYATLSKLKPNIIYGHLTGYGDEDDRAAFDVVLQAETGYMSSNGFSGGEPLKLPLAMIDILGAHQLKEGLVLALWQREKTGKGAYVTASLLAAAVSALSNLACNWLMAGRIAKPIGNHHATITPYGELLTTADGKKTVLAVGTDKQFTHLCEVLGRPELALDPHYQSNHDRVCHRDELMAVLEPLAQQFTREALLAKLYALKVPAGPVLNMQEVFAIPAIAAMVLEEEVDGILTKRPATVGFSIQ